MTTFAYTTGNPSNLTAGATASMNDIQGPFTDLKTFLNGANLDDTNLATANKATTLMGPYRTVWQAQYSIVTGATSGLYMTKTIGGAAGDNANSVDILVFPWDPAHYAVSGRTTNCRVLASTATNSVAPGINFTFGCHTISNVSGTGTFNVDVNNTAISGSTVTRTTPAAGSVFIDVSSDFAAPTVQGLVLCINISGTMPANAFASGMVALQTHYT